MILAPASISSTDLWGLSEGVGVQLSIRREFGSSHAPSAWTSDRIGGCGVGQLMLVVRATARSAELTAEGAGGVAGTALIAMYKRGRERARFVAKRVKTRL